MDKISIRGARTHNLKSINVDLPRDKLIVITGLSGSGKSSLAFDTLYAEGQRRYVESLSSYARQFLSVMEKPDVDLIEGLSPAISIEQKTTSHNPRSTVGTVTELYDYLRVLFARAGQPRCPEHGSPLEAQTVSQMVDQVLAEPLDSKIMLLSPIVRERKGEHLQLLENLRNQGFVRVRINQHLYEIDDVPKLDLRKKHTIEVVIDRIKVRPDLRLRLADSFETTLRLSDGLAIMLNVDSKKETTFSAKYACPICGYSLSELEPRLFSFNNPAGACEHCDGLGSKQFFDPKRVVQLPEVSLASGAVRGWDRRNAYYFSMLKSLAKHYRFDIDTPYKNLPSKIQNIILYGSGEEEITFYFTNERGDTRRRNQSFEGVVTNLERRYLETDSEYIREELAQYLTHQDCPHCEGSRLKTEARNVFIGKKTLPHITSMAIGECLHFFENLNLTGKRKTIADKILKEITQRLRFLVDVGLDYLTLHRTAETLSGGESQRIRLASQIGAGLVGVMYILDEPSIGLHQRDNARLLATLRHLRDLGNTVIVVEHDEDAILSADHIIDIGPGAGVHGGEIVAQGTAAQIKKAKDSLTGQYLSGKRAIPIPAQRKEMDKERCITVTKASGNNLIMLLCNFLWA